MQENDLVSFSRSNRALLVPLLVAEFSQMNFTQMHERLRLELLRRIQRGTLSVSLLARQTGFGQSHLSNFLRSRRQLSLEALDRVLASQHMAADDLLPVLPRAGAYFTPGEENSVPVISHHAALFEPYIRPSVVQSMLHLPPGTLEAVRARVTASRRVWQRFVAIRVTAADAAAMEPLVLPEAIALLDRHYTSPIPYRPNRANLYAVRNGAHLSLRYVEFSGNRLLLRPHNLTVPVETIEVDPGESLAEPIAGRVANILNET
jgi:hypothetical protein